MSTNSGIQSTNLQRILGNETINVFLVACKDETSETLVNILEVSTLIRFYIMNHWCKGWRGLEASWASWNACQNYLSIHECQSYYLHHHQWPKLLCGDFGKFQFLGSWHPRQIKVQWKESNIFVYKGWHQFSFSPVKFTFTFC